MAGKKHYALLDIIIDVLYSITLYNLFTNFPGFGSIYPLTIFVFITVIMLNYWWSSRSISDMPRHYMIDVYFFMLIMFVFTKLTMYITEFQPFVFWLSILFFADFLYTVADMVVEKCTKKWKTYLKHYLVWNLTLAAYYAICFYFIEDLTMISLLAILGGYTFYMIVYIRRKLFKKVLEYEG